ncbi:MAG TPA: cbb3-type cytochrome c oxidase subunit I, partial [Chloroflexota bacterium]
MAAISTLAGRGSAVESTGAPSVGIKYRSQRLAFPYLALSTALLHIMVIFGAIAGAQYVWPDLFLNALNFSISREAHLNLLVFWLLLGLMGATYYLVPEEAESEIFS